MKLMTTALLTAFMLGTISPDVLARGGRGGGKRSYLSHSYKTPSKSRSGGSRQASSGSYASGSQAGGGTYTLTPSGRKNYNGC